MNKKKYLVKWTYHAYEEFEAENAEQAQSDAENSDAPCLSDFTFEGVEVIEEIKED